MVLVAMLAVGCVGCSRSADTPTSSLPRPPMAYAPLPLIATSPALLAEENELRSYINAFPITDYTPHEVPGGGHFFIDDKEDEIKKWVAAGVQWDAHVLELCKSHVEPGTVVIEVGAHIGTHTVPLSRSVGPWGRVYAFEPQRKLYRELYHNLELNGVTNVVPLRYAIGAGEARIIEMDPPRPGNEGGTSIGAGGDRAELRSLDSFGFERVSLIKIDVEGFENAVLDGASETIRRNRPVIVIEIVGGTLYETAAAEVLDRIHGTWKKIEAFGYTVEPVEAHDYIALPARLPGEGNHSG